MYLSRPRHRNHHGRCDRHGTHHHIICEHQTEIEIWPENAEVYFKNERYVDPVNTRVQFESALFNAPTNRVKWEVVSPQGGAGAGSINSSGLYMAPDYGNYTTDIVVATSVDDPTRQATAIVNIVGIGPEPKPEPVIEIFPKVVNLCCRTGEKNRYIDNSNKVQQFRTLISNSDLTNVSWTISSPGGGDIGEINNGGFYKAPQSIGTKVKIVTIHADLTGGGTSDQAKAIITNYNWPA